MSRKSLALFVLLGISLVGYMPSLRAQANETDNPNNSGCEAGNEAECDEGCPEEDGPATGSLRYRLEFGHIPFEHAVSFGRFFIHVPKPSPILFTPQALSYASPISVKLVAGNYTDSDWTVTLVNESAYTVNYRITAGNSVGVNMAADAFFGLYGPAGMQPDVVNRIDRAVAEALKDPVIQERIYGFGLVPNYAPAADLATTQVTHLKRWEAPIKASGYKAE